MKWQLGLMALALAASCGAAQELLRPTPDAAASVLAPGNDLEITPTAAGGGPANGSGDLSPGGRNFPNFIGFLSDPLQSIDPRSLTQILPLFGSTWVDPFPPLPSGDIQVLGPGVNLALTERFCIGLNQGGYAFSHFDRRDRILPGLLDDRRRLREGSGNREGWLNLGGFLQVTVIQDIPNQCLLTAGLRWEAPSGEAEVFQGHGPAYLAPYVTIGKELGNFHVLAIGGYEFPTGPGSFTSNTFYLNLHFDYRLFGWFYPLVEFNGSYHTTQVDLDLPFRRGFFGFGNFESTGNLLTVAPGFNAVLVQNRLEFGAVYVRPITAQHDFDFNGLLVKMVLRF